MDPAKDKIQLLQSLTFPHSQGITTTDPCDTSRFPTAVCASYKTGKICPGDSGGPVVADRNGDGRWVLYGINAFSTGCGSSSGLDGYEDVSQWTNIIMSMITY